jgi:O-antigen ligase
MRISLTHKIETYIFAIITLLIPVAPRLVPLIIILLVITILFRIFTYKNSDKPNKISFEPQDLMIIFFLLYLIGMIYSSNQHFGWKDIEAKLSFIIFPILFAFIRYKNLKINAHFIMLFFVVGCFISTLFNIYNGLNCYTTTNDYSCFLSSSFSSNLHVNYISIYYGSAILILVHLRIPKLAKTALIIWFALFIIAFISLGAYISLFIGVVILVILERKSIKHFSKKIISLVLFSVIIGFALYNEVSSNYDQMYKDINSKEELYFRANKYSESILTRIVIWDIALNELINHPFGVGTGDVKDELIAQYKEEKLTKMERQKLNPHNQYLQTGVSIGFLGILVLISLLTLTIKKSFKKNNTVLAVFTIVIMINMSFESFLEVQAGIVFTALFLYLFDLFNSQNKQFKVKGSNRN